MSKRKIDEDSPSSSGIFREHKYARVSKEDVEDEPMEVVEEAPRRRACVTSVRYERRDPVNLKKGMPAYIKMFDAIKPPLRLVGEFTKEMKEIMFNKERVEEYMSVGGRRCTREQGMLAGTIIEKCFLLDIAAGPMTDVVGIKVNLDHKLLGLLCFILAKARCPRLLYTDFRYVGVMFREYLPETHHAHRVLEHLKVELEWTKEDGVTVFHDSTAMRRVKRMVIPQYHKTEYYFDEVFARLGNAKVIDGYLFLIYLKDFMEKNKIPEAMF